MTQFLAPREPKAPLLAAPAPLDQRHRVFFIHYRFLSCGDVFATGLTHAAQALRVVHEGVWWDDPKLPEKLRAFAPDLVFVVHGRRCAQRWNSVLADWNSAVWLLDEPYEVDDTSRWSSKFQTVFVNDPATVGRHRNSHYLPVCFDPQVHFDSLKARSFSAGFIGGANPRREKWLCRLAANALLTYVAGGPWTDSALKKVCRSGNIPAEETANLYRQTNIVINIFRQRHHYNRQQIPARSLNPRIYEALACGALVISEPRPELEELCPQLPLFHDEGELLELVRQLTGDPARASAVQRECAAMLLPHTYAERLRLVVSTCCPTVSSLNRLEPATVSASTCQASCAAERQPATLDEEAGFPSISTSLSLPKSTHFQPLPFSAMPRRNLIYHVWPVRDSLWRWNIEQLLERIDIFNGRRIIGIVHDSQSELPEEVMKCFEGHGCEFVVRSNNPLGEVNTFPKMLARLASEDPNEITI